MNRPNLTNSSGLRENRGRPGQPTGISDIGFDVGEKRMFLVMTENWLNIGTTEFERSFEFSVGGPAAQWMHFS